MNRYSTKKVDQNQADIVATFMKYGATVQKLDGVGGGCPDLLIGYLGKNILVEVKMPNGTLTDAQWKWHDNWEGECYIAEYTTDVKDILSGLKEVGIG